MIKQNIFIAIIVILCFFGAWAIACAFIKMDVCTTSIINFSADIPTLNITKQDSSYIESHDISSLKIEYEKEYYDATITFMEESEDYVSYMLWIKGTIPKTAGYLASNVIINSLNVYEYIWKK